MELSPSLFAIIFCISSGAFYNFQCFCTFVIMGGALALFFGYKKDAVKKVRTGHNVNLRMIKISMIVIVAATVALFFSILGDNHIFEDSTLPQIIELHMAYAAR